MASPRIELSLYFTASALALATFILDLVRGGELNVVAAVVALFLGGLGAARWRRRSDVAPGDDRSA